MCPIELIRDRLRVCKCGVHGALISVYAGGAVHGGHLSEDGWRSTTSEGDDCPDLTRSTCDLNSFHFDTYTNDRDEIQPEHGANLKKGEVTG